MTITKHVEGWQYLIAQDDAPTTCKATGKELLQQLARAENIAQQKAKELGELREHAADKTRNIMPTLRREIADGKKHTLSDLVAQQLKADDMLKLVNIEKRYADQLVASVNAQLGAAFRQHRAELLHWIATRRIADINAHGYTELITPELKYVYDHLGITWQPKWNEGLALGTSPRLPLVFSSGWVKDAQASAAWVWQRIALGDMRERNNLHYIAAYVDELPRIETSAQHTPPLKRFANS